jgi:tetratricopeptide (TPR) repeat protein
MEPREAGFVIVSTEPAKRLDQSLTDYNQALSLKPDLHVMYMSRGVVYSKKGQYDKALADNDKAAALVTFHKVIGPHNLARRQVTGSLFRFKQDFLGRFRP